MIINAILAKTEYYQKISNPVGRSLPKGDSALKIKRPFVTAAAAQFTPQPCTTEVEDKSDVST
jgi:hypothetical protein